MTNLLTSISEAASGAVTYTPKIDVSGVDFSIVLNEMVNLLPTMLPVVVSCVAFRKGISFMLSVIRGV